MLQGLLEICREIAPIATILASLATVCVIPILNKLSNIETKLNVLTANMVAHEKLDDERFRAHEVRINELVKE